MRNIFSIVLVFSVMENSYSQFITVGSNNNNNRKISKSSCDNASKAGLVEHFFNIIFNEFHSTPPICVCVQMCPDQPTYCYPNGCLKRGEGSKKPDVTLPVTNFSDNTKPIFFLDNKNDFINDLMNKNYVDENKAITAKQTNDKLLNLRPDPFKDRYKILFKYKKMPIVELKYNLGEQVKNMKADSIKKESVDVSKTRWPMNKINHHFNGQRTHTEPQGNGDSKFFVSLMPDKQENHAPKYFKRDLTNTSKYRKDILYTKDIYMVDKSEPENNTFSLDNLIDSLIDSEIEVNNTNDAVTEVFNKTINTSENETNNQTLKVLNNNNDENKIIKQSEVILNNETTNVISMNFTNENVDKNKYIGTNPRSDTNVFRDMIASLSRKIEMQNNTSLEMMRRMTANYDFDTTTTAPASHTETTTFKQNFDIVTTTERQMPSADRIFKTNKKSRQRFARKLQNGKLNHSNNIF